MWKNVVSPTISQHEMLLAHPATTMSSTMSAAIAAHAFSHSGSRITAVGPFPLAERTVTVADRPAAPAAPVADPPEFPARPARAVRGMRPEPVRPRYLSFADRDHLMRYAKARAGLDA